MLNKIWFLLLIPLSFIGYFIVEQMYWTTLTLMAQVPPPPVPKTTKTKHQQPLIYSTIPNVHYKPFSPIKQKLLPPMAIHQILLNEERYTPLSEEMIPREHHLMTWNEGMILELLHDQYPWLWQTYEVMKSHPRQLEDLSKMIILHHYGGIYIRNGINLTKDSIPKILKEWQGQPVEFASRGLNFDSVIPFSNGRPTQQFMCAQKNSAFLSYALHQLPKYTPNTLLPALLKDSLSSGTLFISMMLKEFPLKTRLESYLISAARDEFGEDEWGSTAVQTGMPQRGTILLAEGLFDVAGSFEKDDSIRRIYVMNFIGVFGCSFLLLIVAPLVAYFVHVTSSFKKKTPRYEKVGYV